MRCLVVALLAAACGRSGFDVRPDAATDAATLPDDAALGEFGAPVLIAELSSADSDDDPTLTADLLEIYFDSDRPATGAAAGDIWVARRNSTSEPFGAPQLVTELASVADDTSPEVTPDGLTLYFASDRVETNNRDLYVTTRPNRASAWSPPQRIVELASPSSESSATVVAAGTVMYFASGRSGTSDIYRAEWTGTGWGAPAAVQGASELDDDESEHWVSEDERTLYITSRRATDQEIWFATREAATDVFGPRMLLETLESDADDHDPWVSADQRILVFASERLGNNEIFISTR